MIGAPLYSGDVSGTTTEPASIGMMKLKLQQTIQDCIFQLDQIDMKSFDFFATQLCGQAAAKLVCVNYSPFLPRRVNHPELCHTCLLPEQERSVLEKAQAKKQKYDREKQAMLDKLKSAIAEVQVVPLAT